MARTITLRTLLELASHEAVVREAYLDSVGVWTWSIGVTHLSGHNVHPRYLDNPQSLERCIEVFEWLVRTKYAPDILEAFTGHDLTEEQFAAALSFHYNTGKIGVANWVKRWKAGDISGARTAIMNWKRPPEIIGRRKKERDLFFNGTWSGDGTVKEYKVSKPSYRPDWSSGRRVDISGILNEIKIGGEGSPPPVPKPDKPPADKEELILWHMAELKKLTKAKDISLIFD